MKLSAQIFLLLLLPFSIFAQKDIKIYNPEADAKLDISIALNQAGTESKHVLLQIGGNWCSWCIRLHGFINSHPELDSILHADYIPVYVNYSKENKNLSLMEEFGFPQRFGFPVLVVLNEKGVRIHTQNTWYLEKDKSYDYEKLKRFLLDWNAKAVSAGSY